MGRNEAEKVKNSELIRDNSNQLDNPERNAVSQFDARVNELFKQTATDKIKQDFAADSERCNACWNNGEYVPVHGYGLCKLCWMNFLETYSMHHEMEFCKSCIILAEQKKPVFQQNLCRRCYHDDLKRHYEKRPSKKQRQG